VNLAEETNNIDQNKGLVNIPYDCKAKRALDVIKNQYKDVCKIIESDEFPILERVPDQLLIDNWWAQRPFSIDIQLQIPIMNFGTGQFTSKLVQLDHEIFNKPLRRDLIHRAFKYERYKGYIRTHVGKNVTTKSGSGKKPFAQKKTGRARQGQKRAPRMYGGVKAHPDKMQIMEFYPLNKKVMLQAFKAMLSAKLSEGKIRIVDSEKIELPKTHIVQSAADNMALGNKEKVFLVTGYNVCENFKLGARNANYLNWVPANELTISDMLIADKLVFTVDGLRNLIELLTDKTFRFYSHTYHDKLQSELKSEKDLRVIQE